MTEQPPARLELPAPVLLALAELIDAHHTWRAAPTDHDHHVRHAAATAATQARSRFNRALDAWIVEVVNRDDPPPWSPTRTASA